MGQTYVHLHYINVCIYVCECMCLNILFLVKHYYCFNSAIQNPFLFVITLLCEKAKSISHDSLSILLPKTVDTGGVRSIASMKSQHCQFPTVSTTKERQHAHVQCVKVIRRILPHFQEIVMGFLFFLEYRTSCILLEQDLS